MRLSVNQNNGNTYMAKKYQKMEFFLKIFTQNPKKYQVFTDDYFFGFSISMGGGGQGPPLTRVCNNILAHAPVD